MAVSILVAVGRIVAFAKDVWNLSRDRIRRADPLLMGAAVAYNSLFALVPLAVVFVAMLTIIDRSGKVLDDLSSTLTANMPEDVSTFLIDLVNQSVEAMSGDTGLILIISIVVALWSGSRAVYAVQKALRSVEGVEDTRGYVLTRLMGVGVTAVSAIGVLLAYAFMVLGEDILGEITERFGFGDVVVTALLLLVLAYVWVWLLLWAVYQWGPPIPLQRSGLASAIVAGIVVLGTFVAYELLPSNPSSLAVFGTLGIVLVWLYFIGIVVVAAPTYLGAISGALRNQRSG